MYIILYVCNWCLLFALVGHILFNILLLFFFNLLLILIDKLVKHFWIVVVDVFVYTCF